MPSEKFTEAIQRSKIPILILDNKWHRIFGKVNPTEEIKGLEKELASLIKRQGKLTNEQKDLKKIKNELMDGIVKNMDGAEVDLSEKERQKKLDDNKRLINETNERLSQNEDELLELPKQIDEANKRLMHATMEMCYERLKDNTSEIEEIAQWIKSIRVELKKKVVRKQDLEIYNAELYSYMHDIFGPEVMELFDMKYVPTAHKMPEIKGNSNVTSDTDEDGNKLVE